MIYTFYSYKGGVGRSMAVANVAQWLFLQGLNVLMVDWDLEAPGLEEFFMARPEDLERARAHPGLMDSLLAYKRTYPAIKRQLAAVVDGDAPQEVDTAEHRGDAHDKSSIRKHKAMLLRKLLPPLADAILSLSAPSGTPTASNSLKLLTAGWRDGVHFHDYATAVQSFDWAEFYNEFDGEAYFDWLCDALNAEADVVLVDSRTGVTEMGGVCTRHIADIVVCMCAPNRQNLRGLVDMIRSFRRSALLESRGRDLEVVAVPTRIENSEITLLNQFSTEFTSRLDQFTPNVFKRAQRTFWDLRIPYVPRYAYSETIAVGVNDTASDLELAYKTLAAHLLLLAPSKLVDRAGPELTSAVKSFLPREQQLLSKRVFMSYAGTDGTSFAATLRDRLGREGSEFAVFDPTYSLTTGVAWSNEIEVALSQSNTLIAIITPAVVTAGAVLRTIRTARSQGISIVLVLGALVGTMDLESLPAWLRTYHLFDPECEWEALLGALRSDKRPSMIPFMAPPLPTPFVSRELELETVISLLITARVEQTSVSSISTVGVALVGLGGIGKTVLASAISHDPRVVDEFYDGIIWTTLGAAPDVVSALTQLYAGLTSERPGFLGIDDAAASLQEALRSRRCLIVLDDVWSEAHLQPFLRGGHRCATLITTRNHDVARMVPNLVEIGRLSVAQADRMLTSYLDERERDSDMLIKLAESVGRHPLTLHLLGSMLRERVQRGDSVGRTLEYARSALERRGITAFDRGRTLFHALEASLEQLTTEERSQCALLAAFPEDRAIPLASARAFWEVEEFDAEEFAQKLDTMSLVSLDLGTRTISLHPVIREFLRESLRNRETLEKRAALLLPAEEAKELVYEAEPSRVVFPDIQSRA